MTLAVYRRLCPSCYGRIEDTRLKKGLLCRICERNSNKTFPRLCTDPTVKRGALETFCETELRLSEFVSFFNRNIGSNPYPLQLAWARRILTGHSFALIAPTGVGKTTFTINMAAFLPGKVYIIVPTRLLASEIYDKILHFSTSKRVVAYTGKKREKESIIQGNYDILITTTSFLARNKEIFKEKRFDFVFVDDVDSLLKTGRNVDVIMNLLGVSNREIHIAQQIVKLKSTLLTKPDNSFIAHRIEVLRKQLESTKNKRGILTVSSATITPRTGKIKIIREIFGFEIGREISSLRNIDDFVVPQNKSLDEDLLDLISLLKEGVFVFVSSYYGKNRVNEIKDLLNKHGIKTITYEEFDDKNKKAFVEGNIDVVVGIANTRNPLVRGIDLPHAVRFAVFYGVPRIDFPVKVETVGGLYGLLGVLKSFADKDRAREIKGLRDKLRKYAYLNRKTGDIRSKEVNSIIEQGQQIVKEMIESPNVLSRIEKSSDVLIEKRDNELFISIGDSTAYIQASGRTSRLFKGILLKGASFLLMDSEKIFNSLKKRLFYLGFDIEFQPINLSEREKLKGIVENILRTRNMSLTQENEKERINLQSALLIVESPNKARTIASFFGKPLKREVAGFTIYEISIEGMVLLIFATKGHIFDLVVKEGKYGVIDNAEIIPVYDTIKFCRKCNEQTVEDFCPVCGKKPDEDKIELVKALRELGFEVNTIYLAQDPDTEGEKIAWDVLNLMSIFPRTIKRAEFHEVTRHAILNAIRENREVDENRVKAQIIRRIADRWIGFSLSQKLKEHFKESNLSAGRVQTPVLGWIIDRTHRARIKKKIIVVKTQPLELSFELGEDTNTSSIKDIEYILYSIEKREKELLPVIKPYNTSSVLKDSSLKLGFSAKDTMSLLQDLFESGLITYHRTDSHYVSSWGMNVARKYIEEHFGMEFVHLRPFTAEKSAHECIRPTMPIDTKDLENMIEMRENLKNIRKEHVVLYELILNRFIASQMRQPVVEKALVEFVADLKYIKLIDKKSLILQVLERGYDLIFPQRTVQLTDNRGYLKVISHEIKSVPLIVPFNQGELVDMMRKKGIGRPSTYAKIIDTLLKRRYVIERRGRLYATRKGEKVYKFLNKHFHDVVSENLTYEIEKMQDKVEDGSTPYTEVLLVLKKWREKIENTTV